MLFWQCLHLAENPLWQEQIQARITLRDINLKFWLEYNLFTPVWWLMLITLIGVWLIWFKWVDKSRLLEIIAYGLMVAFLATIFDLTGAELVLWGYPNMLVPLMPPLFLVDLGILPVAYMLVYQYFSRWKGFTIAMTLNAAFLAFLGEPIAQWLNIYQVNNWKHIYSFPIYIALGLFLKWIMKIIITKQNKANS